jgi:hypothetical protein
MDALRGVENKLVEVNKSLPQIPENGKKILAEWFWVIAIIGVVLGAMGIVAILGIGVAGSALLTGLGGGLLAVSMWPMLLFGVLGMALTVVLELMAINPLKHRQYRGWQFMFAAVILQVIFSILQAVFTNSFSSVLGALLSFVIGAYLLAQVHSYFVKNGRATHPNSKK